MLEVVKTDFSHKNVCELDRIKFLVSYEKQIWNSWQNQLMFRVCKWLKTNRLLNKNFQDWNGYNMKR